MAYFGGTVSQRPWPRVDARFIIVFVLSFCGIAASIILARDIPLFSKEPTPQPVAAVAPIRELVTAPTSRTILVAGEEIPAGARLIPSMFRLESRPVDELRGQAVENLDDLTGAYTRVGIAENTPLLRAAMTRTESTADITARIPSGYRAVAIPVNVLTGVEGWVRPGATVDVVWSTTQGQRQVVSTIVENAKVLSVERSLDPEKNRGEFNQGEIPNHITLLVTSADAQKIQLAKGTGSLNLSLRGNDDEISTGSKLLTSESLLKRRDRRGEIQGKVMLNGQEYVLHNDALVPRRKFEEDLKVNTEQ